MSKAERKILTNPPDHWRAYEDAATKAGMTLSAWVRAACNDQLPRKVRDRLSEPLKGGRPRNQEDPQE